MKVRAIMILLLAILPAALGSSEIIYFADDHYKALGSPDLMASAATPAFDPGKSGVLEIDLANAGRADELIPSDVQPGSEAASSAERSEELGIADAFDLTARLELLQPSESIKVVSGPVRVPELPSGAVVPLNFTIEVDGRSEGRYGLILNISYERQADVSVSDGGIFPLYLPETRALNLTIEVSGQDRSPMLVGVRSDLSPGRNGTVLAMIKNSGEQASLSARLIAAPPFHTSDYPVILGSLGQGQVAVAGFEVSVDDNATLQEYRLACEVGDGNRTVLLPVPVVLEKSSIPVWPILGIAFASALILAAWRLKARQI
ncbi:MAG TPA: hypothetical protein VN455_00920 [Methanotrichaceae archaeon]|nr:hypothetical protein [Methanotrichaceae archaeon]